jgi:hypothetical protein
MSAETVLEKANEPAGVKQELAIENSIEIYQITAEWIRFADAKAAVVLTVGGGLAGVLVPHLKPYLEAVHDYKAVASLAPLVLGCYALWLILLVVSAVYAFRCIVPYRKRGKHPALDFCQHFHSAAISTAYGPNDIERFFDSYRKLGHEKMLREVMAGLLIDAHISSNKYAHVTSSIRLLACSSVFGFLFLLLSQF